MPVIPQTELKAVDKALKLDPKNTELLKQKQELLGKAVEETKKKVETLKKAKEKADNDMKNGTEVNEEGYRALQREIVNTENSLKNLTKQSEEAQKSGGKLSDVGSNLKSLATPAGIATAAVAGVAKGLSDLEEETREYREDLNKLDTAFKTTNKSVESGRKVYNEFFQILGESDRSVEAVNHLAELCKTEQELNDWTTICAGVTAKFGDSLPIEGLTEAANETAKVGAVTGPLADALNWAGISEDEFNEKLKACSSEQERSSLITETLTTKYSSAAESYKTMNSDVMALRESQERLNEAQAKIGEVIAPVKAALTDFAATALTNVAEALGQIKDGTAGMTKENAALVTSIQGSITE